MIKFFPARLDNANGHDEDLPVQKNPKSLP